MVKLRLKRLGRKKNPSYRIVAINNRYHREGLILDQIGFYSPLFNKTRLNVPLILKYLKNGAQPTKTVHNIFIKAKVFEQLKKI
uniref:Small ribosomal subunit protein bS16c n=1 Tax=Verdigellas peltata TaxID=542676 RepID=A0A170TQ99_9VIRI|nr:ribosomal protein S16 [Verdigellas peltata]CZF96700.1 ribosomal protein S16 [Verdigellas peltata]